VAGGAGANAIAGVLDFDVVLEHDVANRLAARRFDDRALGAEHGMGQEYELWHFFTSFIVGLSFPWKREPMLKRFSQLSMGSRLRGNDVLGSSSA
jgi:hypothetical protein